MIKEVLIVAVFGLLIGSIITNCILFSSLKTTIKTEIQKLKPINSNGKIYYINKECKNDIVP